MRTGGEQRPAGDRTGAAPAGQGVVARADRLDERPELRPELRAVLRLQRDAGNAAVRAWMARTDQPARRFHVGVPPAVQRATAQRVKVKHTTGAQVDAYATASPFLKTYVESKIKGGTKADGHVHIHAPAAFKTQWVTYAMGRSNPATGARYTKAEAEADEPRINAFRDGSEIHIHEERGETATAIHEAMHLFSHDNFKAAVGFNANEGATEYFARVLCTEQSISRGNYYAAQLGSVTRLVGAASKEKLADGYYNGAMKGLEDGAEAKAKGTWAKWVDYMKKGQYSSADALL